MKKRIEYSEYDRAYIRLRLQRYMQRMDFGAPKLVGKIIDEMDFHVEQVPQKTLQRFLKGTATDELMVRRYEQFLERVDPPPPYELMGEALQKFYGRELAGKGERVKDSGEVAGSFASVYRCYLRGEYSNDEMEMPDGRTTKYHTWPKPPRSALDPPFEIPYALLFLEPIPKTHFVKVVERVVNEKRDDAFMDVWYMAGAGPDRFIEGVPYNEGVMAVAEGLPCYMATLRQDHVHLPKLYMLHHTYEEESRTRARAPLLGACIAPNGNINAYNPIAAFEVKLYPELGTEGGQ